MTRLLHNSRKALQMATSRRSSLLPTATITPPEQLQATKSGSSRSHLFHYPTSSRDAKTSSSSAAAGGGSMAHSSSDDYFASSSLEATLESVLESQRLTSQASEPLFEHAVRSLIPKF